MASSERQKIPPSLTPEALTETRAWYDKEHEKLPAGVAASVRFALFIADGMSHGDYHQRAMLSQLRRAMGIIPSTESRGKKNADRSRMPSDRRSKLRDKIERLRHKRDNAAQRCAWHRLQLKRQNKILRDETKRLMKLEDVELTAEEEAEVAAATELHMVNLDRGARCDLACAHATETLMAGAGAQVQTKDIDCDVDRLGLKKGTTVKKELFEERRRLDFSFSVTEVNVNVEKLVLQTPSGGTEIVSASLDEVGPPKMKVTWSFLVNMAVLVAQYAMPLNRFAGLVSSSSKQFKGGEISRYFCYTAERFVPIYVVLGRALANAPVLVGDDTTSRVLEISRGLIERRNNSNAVASWDVFSTQCRARALLKKAGSEASISVIAASAFGFEFARKDGSGSKEGFNTTVLSGRTDIHDPKSTIVFYRSHLGGLGNLLDVILAHRRAELKDLVVQCDLSTVNLISDAELKKRLNVTIAGCAAHARRPFVHHETHETTGAVPALLHSFLGVFMYEKSIEEAGRNTENTLAIREIEVQECWTSIKEICEILAQRWSTKTPLGVASRYVLRHYDKLTYYLKDARVGPSNNFSERMLRPEKLIENSALFRQTLDGRCALDIMRTILQTAVAAKVDLHAYLLWVMQMPAESVIADPDAFTPLAYAKYLSGSGMDAAQSNRTAA
jgi:hypothetical protein